MPNSKNKIVPLEDLEKIISDQKKLGKKVALCHGAFDLIHAGHIKYLQKAKTISDTLVVTLTGDDFIRKGPGRPVFNEELRSENIAALACVDFVCINYEVDAIGLLKKVKPDLYVKGSDYIKPEDDVTGNIKKEIDAIKSVGGDIFFTNEITFSSSNLINSFFDVYSPDTRDFLNNFRKLENSRSVLQQIDSLEDLRVLVIGDAIIDQYDYVNHLGQTGKGNVTAAQFKSQETFLGGSIAIANHISEFVKKVTLLTAFGDKDNYEIYTKERIPKNITLISDTFANSSSLIKKRYVDDDLNKFFEIYLFSDNPQLANKAKKTIKWLSENIHNFDLVISADFGNGFFNSEIRNILSDKSKFLAVNTQINSGNRGHHVITSYKRANFISLNEPELRLATHNRFDSIEHLMLLISKKLDAKYISITRGTKGAVMLDYKKEMFSKIPSLSSRVIDRIGAGDAYLAISSIALAGKLDFNIANFLGSIAAAMDVQIVCNRSPIDKINLKKYIETLLK